MTFDGKSTQKWYHQLAVGGLKVTMEPWSHPTRWQEALELLQAQTSPSLSVITQAWEVGVCLFLCVFFVPFAMGCGWKNQVYMVYWYGNASKASWVLSWNWMFGVFLPNKTTCQHVFIRFFLVRLNMTTLRKNSVFWAVVPPSKTKRFETWFRRTWGGRWNWALLKSGFQGQKVTAGTPKLLVVDVSPFSKWDISRFQPLVLGVCSCSNTKPFPILWWISWNHALVPFPRSCWQRRRRQILRI